VKVEQPGHVAGVDPAHPALGTDAPLAGAGGRGGEGGVDVLDLAGGRAWGLIGGVVGDEREVELGVRAGLQIAQRLEVRAVVAVLGTVNETKSSRRRLPAVTALTRSTCICREAGCFQCSWP